MIIEGLEEIPYDSQENPFEWSPEISYDLNILLFNVVKKYMNSHLIH